MNPNNEPSALEQTLVNQILQRIINHNPDAALKTDLAQDEPDQHFALFGEDAQTLRKTALQAASTAAVMTGTQLVLNPGEDDQLGNGTVVVVDDTGLDREFQAETMAVAARHALDRQGPTLILGNQVTMESMAAVRIRMLTQSACNLIMVAAINPQPGALPEGFVDMIEQSPNRNRKPGP